ncbi:hypothetical protein EHS25_005798 [Saitozyma podzolica]|uniref:Uncharacterized protein n=1 Tax=Saitozyma podzolica TaxID=1890683 RepID=A0A427XV81_9TREE|nr:hypothetical protein EHS25_005798 [Saitozyma podzolica]
MSTETRVDPSIAASPLATSADRRDSALSAASATSANSASSGHPGVNNEHLKARNFMYGWLGKIKPSWGDRYIYKPTDTPEERHDKKWRRIRAGAAGGAGGGGGT